MKTGFQNITSPMRRQVAVELSVGKQQSEFGMGDCEACPVLVDRTSI